MATSTDRRVQRTRQLLQEALLALVQEKPYDKITVQEILDRANVGRSTFYAHFHDKDELLTGNFASTVADQIFAQHSSASLGAGKENEASSSGDVCIPLLPLLHHARENHHLYVALKGSEGFKTILGETRKRLQEMLTVQIQELRPNMSTPERDVALHFLSEGVMAAMLHWLETESEMPAETLDGQLQAMMLGALPQIAAHTAK